MKFYYCNHCGNIIIYANNQGVPVICCGEKMTLLPSNKIYNMNEDHVPVVEIDGNRVVVKIGEIPHPMTAAHYISWVILETNNGFQRKELEPIICTPQSSFLLCPGEIPLNAFAFCNQHQLWMKKI
jgi:superoxide reductase